MSSSLCQASRSVGLAALLALSLAACPSSESPRPDETPTCTDECAAGTKLCDGDSGLRTCGQFDEDSCLELSAPTPCASGLRCFDGQCAAGCQDGCGGGSKVCRDRTTLLGCGNFDSDDCLELGAPTDCGEGRICEAGACVPVGTVCSDECLAGLSVCDGDAVRTCGQYDDDPCADLSTPSPCDLGEQCQLGSCVPACADDCATPGEKVCQGNGVATCELDLQTGCLAWSAPQACPQGQTCSGGNCSATCTDDCASAGNSCNAASTGVVACGQFDDDSCLDLAAVVPCGTGFACSGGACVATCSDECQPGQARCGADGHSVESCGDFDDDPCREFGGLSQCQGGAACADGSCASGCADECAAGAVECIAGQAAIRTCGNFDTDACRDWSAPTQCQGYQVCSAGSCVLGPPPGTVLINEVAYDSAGTDSAAGNRLFLELWGTPYLPLDGFSVVGVNGNGGADYATISLDGHAIGADGFLLIAHPNGAQDLRDLAQLTGNLIDFQNGPDSIQVRWHGQAVDALAYGSFGSGAVDAGEGAAAPVALAGTSLSRDASHTDTNDNAADFSVATPTPRADVASCTSSCPALDQTECAGTQVRVCADPDGDGCLAWSVPTDCPSGQQCAGNACMAVDPCSPNPCTEANKTVCTASGSAAVCSCDPGYQADASGVCTPIDPCSPNPCTAAHRSVCQAVGGVAICQCDQGYGDDGSGVCVQIDPCSPNPCIAAHQTVCAATSATTAVCGCDPGYVPSGTTCVLEQATSCANSHPGDAFEPDECPADARLAVLPASQTRTFSPAGDADWVALDAIGGHVYSLSATTDGPLPALMLYAADGTTMQSQATPSSGRVASLRVKLEAGRHYLKVRASSATATGNYTLAISDEGADDHSDVMAGATPLAPTTAGAQASGAFQFPGDADVFAVPVTAGRIYRLEEIGSADVMIRVFTATQQLCAWVDYESFVFESAAAETVYLAVRAYSGTGQTFTVKATDLGVDDHADSMAGATPLTPAAAGAQATGVFQYPYDHEVFAVPLAAGRIYRLEEASSTDVKFHVFASNGADLSAWADEPESFAFESANAQTVFVEVIAYSGYDKSFTVKATDLGVDDHGDSMADATALTLTTAGALATGVFQYPYDHEVFAVMLAAGRIYRFEEASSTDVRFHVFASNGGDLYAWADEPESFTYESAAAQTVFVEVVPYSGFDKAFTVKVTDVGVDDHGDAADTATRLVPTTSGAHVTGVFEYPFDYEVFAVPVVAGRIYRLEEATTTDVMLRVDAGSSELLAWSDEPESFTFESAASETVYLKVRQYSGFGGSFTVKATDLGVDDHGDAAASATSVALGTTTSGAFQYPRDWDFLSVPVVAGRVYRFAETSPTNVWIRLVDAAGSVVSTQDSPETLVWKSLVSGTAAFGVSAYSSTPAAEPWSVELTDLGPDDHGDDRTTATALTVGTAAAGEVQFPGDSDYFKVTVTANDVFAFQCLTTGLATQVAVYSSASTTALASGAGANGFAFTVPGPGDYYVRVRANTSGATGAYTVLVRN